MLNSARERAHQYFQQSGLRSGQLHVEGIYFEQKNKAHVSESESFDPCNAASRMVRFFDEKCELFGADKLTKDITLEDLDPDDIITLENGFYQVLPEKDCVGRKAFCQFPKLRVTPTIKMR